MIEWTYSQDGHSATLNTQLVQLRIVPDSAHSTPDAIHYRVQVCNRQLAALCEARDLATMDAAQAWCIAQYRALLAVAMEATE